MSNSPPSGSSWWGWGWVGDGNLRQQWQYLDRGLMEQVHLRLGLQLSFPQVCWAGEMAVGRDLERKSEESQERADA